MRRSITTLFLGVFLLANVSLAGDLRISIQNGSTGSPGEAERVAVVDLGQGMMEIASETNVKGSVTLSNVAPDPMKQYLVRATVDGVNYSTMFVPNATVTAWETSITVYDTRQKMESVVASVPYFVIYAFTDHLYIQKRYMLENQSQPPVTFYEAPGVVEVYVPDDVKEMDYLTFKHGTMPLNSQPIQVGDKQVIPNALKPGNSEIDIAYSVPYNPNGTTVSEYVPYEISGHFHVYTMPMDLGISAPGLTREGSDQQNGLAIWSLDRVAAGTMLSFAVSGTGMREDQPQQQQQQQQQTGRILVEHRIDINNKLVISAVLLLGIVIALFFSITQQQSDLQAEAHEALKHQREALLKKYAALSKDGAKGDEAENTLHQLISVYKTLERIKR